MKNIFAAEKNPLSLKQLKENWGWYLALGIGLVILGSLAIYYAYTATIFSVIYLGVALIILGVFEGIQAFKLNRWSNFFLHMFLSVLSLVAGCYMIYNPVINAISLTFVLSIFFIVSGILKVIFALLNQMPHRLWLLINGICTTILGILIWQQWPVSGVWALGLLLGVDMIFTGWTWIMLSLAAKSIRK